MKPSGANQPRKLLARFVAGSLVVIFVSLLSVSLWFAAQHVKQEQSRAALAQRQILGFFENQYESLAEEMWTGSFDSMEKRVADIASQLGTKGYEVFIADTNGRCVHHARNDHASNECSSPRELLALAASSSQQQDSHASSLRYDEHRKRNIYLVPLVVGTIMKGYLFAAVPDPFDFYRGDFLSLAFQSWLPPLLVVIILWTAWLLVSKTYLIDPYLVGLVRLKRKEALAHQAQQVAHDLRNPVATILSMARTLKGVPEDRKELIRGAADSIREIANDLLRESPAVTEGVVPSAVSNDGYSLSPVVRAVVAEARARYSEKSALSIEVADSPSDALVPAALEPIELKRVLHNLIANAAESVDGSGVVRVETSDGDGCVTIKVVDNGRGIPAHILSKLGSRGASFGKHGGSGLGLFHAKETVTRVGGTIDIRSEANQGTTVIFKIPSVTRGLMVPCTITVPRGGTVAILDDEKISHRCWDMRLEESADREFEVKHFYDADELRKWWNDLNGSRERVLLLCDYFLGKHLANGLEVIEELGATTQAVLVTGLAGDSSLQAECRKRKIRLLSKEQITVVTLHVD